MIAEFKWIESPAGRNPAVLPNILAAPGDLGWIRLAPRDGWNQQDAISLFQRTAFAAKKANILFIQIDVEKLPNLSPFVANMPRKGRKARGQIVQRFGDRRRSTVNLWRAVCKAAERRWNFNGNWHVCCVSLLCPGSSRGDGKLVLKVGFEGINPWLDSFRVRKFRGDGVGRLQAVSGDADDGSLIRPNAALSDEFLRHAR